MAKKSGVTTAYITTQVLPANLARHSITISNLDTSTLLFAEFGGKVSIPNLSSEFNWSGFTEGDPEWYKNILVAAGHSYEDGEAVVFSSDGELPAGLTAGTVYYVTVEDVDTFKVSTTKAAVGVGPFVEMTSYGDGTHTVSALEGGWVVPKVGSISLSVEDYPEIRGTVNLKSSGAVIYSVRTSE